MTGFIAVIMLLTCTTNDECLAPRICYHGRCEFKENITSYTTIEDFMEQAFSLVKKDPRLITELLPTQEEYEEMAPLIFDFPEEFNSYKQFQYSLLITTLMDEKASILRIKLGEPFSLKSNDKEIFGYKDSCIFFDSYRGVNFLPLKTLLFLNGRWVIFDIGGRYD